MIGPEKQLPDEDEEDEDDDEEDEHPEDDDEEEEDEDDEDTGVVGHAHGPQTSEQQPFPLALLWKYVQLALRSQPS